MSATSRGAWWPRKLRVRATDLVDVLVYLVVLGAFIQLFPSVIAESFLLALLTAVVLKIVMDILLAVKKATVARLRGARTGVARAVNIATLVLLLPGSKFVVLELIALLFGDAVKLGGFFAVTILVVVLTLARGLVRALLAPSATPRREDAAL
ncbi:hypothetical protein [Microbacterium sp. RURRCA19A]|uniref:hypothetical protein n=1 Tax=Microbacterium sp. RURRCA19A TaxID=1907391 RepID=UPI000955FBDD|nr:hypothetical protein [Microbacterium sp. RURRCA19A]SIS13039.1 hypothetical protein SAMN05880568_2910 [Microbacterium sp. RURRCA19A]